MNRKREAMRAAGWIAVVAGVVSVALAVVTDVLAFDVAAAYGLLFALTGAWTVAGLALLSRHERRTAQARAASRILPGRGDAVSR